MQTSVVIINNEGKEVSLGATIKAYFGTQPEQTLSMFMDELKQLTPAAKLELAVGAAKELGWTVKES